MSNEQNPPRPNLSLNERPSVAFHLIKFGIWTLALAFAGLIVLFAGRELGLLSKPCRRTHRKISSLIEDEQDGDGERGNHGTETRTRGDRRGRATLETHPREE